MLIVFNPAAGAGGRRRLTRALSALARLGLRPELAETERPGHATVLARDAAARGVPMVVAAGGDGTIAEVAMGITGSAAALGLLPLGTANVLASELGVPGAPERAAAVLAGGRSAVLRPGIATWPDGRRRLFVQMIGAGFDAAVVHRLDLELKRRLGRSAYVVQSARELLRYPFPRFAATLDGGAAESVVSAIVTKGRHYAGRHLLAPGARPAEPGFQVALFHRGGPGFAALCGAALPLDLLPHVPGVVLRAALQVRLAIPADPSGERDPGGVPLQADGDPAGWLPVRIEDSPAPIVIRLPGPG